MSAGLKTSVHEPSWTATLRRFVEKPALVERCELCGAELAAEHEHLVESATRKLLCACDGCAILFDYQADMKYRRVPRRIEKLDGFRLSDVEWNALGLPIGLAFFFHSSAAEKVIAMYPSPAGATESLLSLETWADVVRDNPVLCELEPDVEALLVNRVRDTRAYYRAPIDQCYTLVGLIRRHWRGLSGGTEVWKHIGQFFANLNQRAVPRK